MSGISLLKRGISNVTSFIQSNNAKGEIPKLLQKFYETSGMSQEFKDDLYFDISQQIYVWQLGQLESSSVLVYVVGGGSLSEYELVLKLRDSI